MALDKVCEDWGQVTEKRKFQSDIVVILMQTPPLSRIV